MLTSLFTSIRNATINLPALEVSGVVIILSSCLVFRLNRVGLVAAYIFVYRWGSKVVYPLGESAFYGYVAFGIIVGALTIVALMRPRSSDD